MSFGRYNVKDEAKQEAREGLQGCLVLVCSVYNSVHLLHDVMGLVFETGVEGVKFCLDRSGDFIRAT